MSEKRYIITIKTIIGKLKLQKNSADLVSGFTQGRTEHVSEMTSAEQLKLIGHLQFLQGTGTYIATTEEDDAKDRMRKKIISKYREMNYNKWSDVKGRMVADMEKIKEHLLLHWKKDINDFTAKELTRIISVLDEQFLPWYYANLNKESNAQG